MELKAKLHDCGGTNPCDLINATGFYRDPRAHGSDPCTMCRRPGLTTLPLGFNSAWVCLDCRLSCSRFWRGRRV